MDVGATADATAGCEPANLSEPTGHSGAAGSPRAGLQPGDADSLAFDLGFGATEVGALDLFVGGQFR